jgi:hypothetical protein
MDKESIGDSTMANKPVPVKSKLTLKGDSPEKLASKGVDVNKLHNYTMPLSTLDISKESSAMAKKACEYIASLKNSKGMSYADLLEQVNVKGYMSALEAQIKEDIEKLVLGTASQGRAYKRAIVASTEGLELSDFDATPKAGKKVEASSNVFA